MTRKEKIEYLTLRTEKERRFNQTKLFRYKPYPKQEEFHAAGAKYQERLFSANNQFGKTMAGAAELAIHLTGLYPDWWIGKRFTVPVAAWAVGVTNLTTRDVVQEKLIGPPDRPDEWGTGLIPGNLMLRPKLARSVDGAIDSVGVKWAGGGLSTVWFKAYEQGREKFQGPARHVIWQDEEGPLDIYFECLARTLATGGVVYTTFTPEKGWTQLVELFLGASG